MDFTELINFFKRTLFSMNYNAIELQEDDMSKIIAMNTKLYEAIKCDTVDNFIECQSKITSIPGLKDALRNTTDWKNIFSELYSTIWRRILF